MKRVIFLIIGFTLYFSIKAQTKPTVDIFINSSVSTHIISPEPIRFVDISTNDVVGDIPIDNVLRIKPIKDSLKINELVGVATVITDRGITQLNLIYKSKDIAYTQYKLDFFQMDNYINPDVSMPRGEMYNWAYKVWNCSKKFYDVSKGYNKLRLTLNNIYTINNHFFIDISIENFSNIQFDIDEVRFKIEDKKQVKATNYQSIEVEPTLELLKTKAFKRNYRNVFVFEKFTFPDEKVFIIEVSEKQYSGRTILLSIDYADVLNADAFSKGIL